MNTTPPLACGALLAAMMAAGFSHYWTVSEVVSNYPSKLAYTVDPTAPEIEPVTLGDEALIPTPAAPSVAPPATATAAPLASNSSEEREFYAALLAEMKSLRTENKNLIDQIGETNRDMMKMEFRMDTYSESFRPLPVQERIDDTTFGADPEFPGVLPPKATPVYQLEN